MVTLGPSAPGPPRRGGLGTTGSRAPVSPLASPPSPPPRSLWHTGARTLQLARGWSLRRFGA